MAGKFKRDVHTITSSFVKDSRLWARGGIYSENCMILQVPVVDIKNSADIIAL